MNKDIREHIEVLSNYFTSVRELVELVQSEPEDEYEMNYYIVRVRELEVEIEHLAKELGESVQKISKIQWFIDKWKRDINQCEIRIWICKKERYE